MTLVARLRVGGLALPSLLVAVACSKPPGGTGPGGTPWSGTSAPAATLTTPTAPEAPRSSVPMTVHFYDVGQALAALVDLPDGRHVLVDAGDAPEREGCGRVCARAHAHLMSRLKADLAGAPIDMLWITHQHSDHLGGAPDVLASLPVRLVVDNGRDARKAEVRHVHEAAAAAGAMLRVVDPSQPQSPLPSSAGVSVRAVLPPAWPRSCKDDENECSIALRFDDGASSMLFVGDAEHEEETQLDAGGPVTLLQVGHHGSETSSSPALLSRLKPRYAVISAGKPGEGLNREYCLPRAGIIERLSRVLDGSAAHKLTAFDGERCDRATRSDWIAVPTSDRLWATERDGDVVLTTIGDGVFRRVP